MAAQCLAYKYSYCAGPKPHLALSPRLLRLMAWVGGVWQLAIR